MYSQTHEYGTQVDTDDMSSMEMVQKMTTNETKEWIYELHVYQLNCTFKANE